MEDEWSGRVMQSSLPIRTLPPASFVLSDPQVEIPLLTLLAQPAAGGAPVRINLWGLWCDRLCEVVQTGHVITVHGGSTAHDPSSPIGERDTLTLPPSGAPPHAAVHVDSEVRHIEVTPKRMHSILVNRPALPTARPPMASTQDGGVPAAASDTMPGATAADVGGAAAKRRKASASYHYTRLDDLPERTDVPGGPKEVHLFGVVLEYMLPRDTRGTDMKSVLQLVDESCSSPQDALVVSFFKCHPMPPGVGSVVRLHRLCMRGTYDGMRQASGMSAGACASLTSYVFGDFATFSDEERRACVWQSSANVTWTEHDSRRVAELHAWSSRAFGQPGPFSTLRTVHHSLSDLHQRPTDQPLDILAQLGPLAVTAASSAAKPRAEAVLLCKLSSPRMQHAELTLAAGVGVHAAQKLVEYLQLPSAAGYGSGWVRLRLVRLSWRRAAVGQPAVPRITLELTSSLLRLPDGHAALSGETRGAPPAVQPPSQLRLSLLPPGAAAPPTSSSGMYTRALPAHVNSRTSVRHQQLPVLSISQVQDQHRNAPSLLRTRARVVGVFPTDPFAWTQLEDSGGNGGRYEYRMVLQLADVDDPTSYIGAYLLGDEAALFFSGLPPADLQRSNVTLAALQQRIDLLCDLGGPPVEFCLVSYRPCPQDDSETGVAYRVHATTLIASR
ncbi:hypothetical protein AB1Y20_015135 [Prymnesium parvum]|uniref:Telomeric single stranded DNA binding POT1/Cdc13 domain-containing protein n=1 Tax=Prymnesium parvum TaxID=97485 RepID=A0AB34JZI7_PRYPA